MCCPVAIFVGNFFLPTIGVLRYPNLAITTTNKHGSLEITRLRGWYCAIDR